MADGFFNTTDNGGQSNGTNPYIQNTPPHFQNGMTKTCKYCGSQIPAGAKVCPYCRKKQKGKGGLIAIIVIVILIIIIAAAASGDDKPKKVTTSSTSSSAKSTSSKSSKKDKKEDTTFTVGDTADFDGVKVKLSSAILSKGSEANFAVPDKGKYFLALIFDIENDSDEDITVSTWVSFEAYCDDMSIDMDYTGEEAPEVDGLNQLDGDVASGKKMNGIMTYQVPKDFKKFEISYQPDFWGDKKVTFEIPSDKVDWSSVK